MRPEDVESLTVGGLLDLVTERRPETDALVYVDRGLRYSYKQFNEVVERCARALIALGLEKGDHVAVWGQNVPEWVTLQFATGKTGTVLVTINPAYKATELRYVLEQSDAAALFLTKGVKEADFVEILQDTVPDLANAEPGEGRLADRRVDHAARPEAVEHALGHLVRAVVLRDLLAHQEHVLVALHLLGHGGTEGFAELHHGHVYALKFLRAT